MKYSSSRVFVCKVVNVYRNDSLIQMSTIQCHVKLICIYGCSISVTLRIHCVYCLKSVANFSWRSVCTGIYLLEKVDLLSKLVKYSYN